MQTRLVPAAALLGMMLTTPPAQAGLTIQVDALAGTPTEAVTAFGIAAGFWADRFSDDVALRFMIGTETFGSTALATTLAASMKFSYAAVHEAMIADALGSTDAAALQRLPNTTSFSIYLNHTLNSPYGAGSDVGYIDNDGNANNSTIRLTTANAKALGLTVPLAEQTMLFCVSACDGFFGFSPDYSFDYDRADGIGAGQYDFIGIAMHEIGHALGFVSGVDVLDQFSVTTMHSDFEYDDVSALDLFRCSAAATLAGGLVDFTVNNTPVDFSLNSDCSSPLAAFSTGQAWGDGYGAGHWKNGLGLGIMDPTTAAGELLVASAIDSTAFDAIGWNLTENAVPAPGGPALIGLALSGLAALRLRRRRSSARH